MTALARRDRLDSKAIVLGVLIVAAKVVVTLPQLRTDLALVAITWVVVISFVVVGVALLSTEDIADANGWNCLVVAAATLPGDLNNAHFPPSVAAVGFVLEPTYLAAAVALVLRYPRARLNRRGRFITAGLVITSVVWRIPLVFFAGDLPSPFHDATVLPNVEAAPWWFDWVWLRAGYLGTIMLLIGAAGLLVIRAVTSRGLIRTSLAPLAIVGAVCALSAAADNLIWVLGIPGPQFEPIALIRNFSAAAIPVALLGDLIRRRGASAAISSHVLQAARSGDVLSLEGALRDVLLDRTLTVRPTSDLTPQSPAAGDKGGPRRSVTVTSAYARTPLVVIEFDVRSVTDEALLRTVLAAVQVGLDNTQLTQELLQRMTELEASRARIVQAGAQERRKVERDLHDGAQQQFLAVAATLAKSDFVSDQELRDVVQNARVGLSDALAELRQLARGIHPAALSQGGLSAALPYLCDQSPLHITLHIDDSVRGRSIAPAVETAMYFIAAESLANAARHAPDSEVVINLTSDQARVNIEISDHGRGGARFAEHGGLVGLRDRAEALDGELDVHSDPCPEHPDDAGSRVSASFPIDGRTV